MRRYFIIIYIFSFLSCKGLEILNLKTYSNSFSVTIEWETDKEADSRLFYSPFKSLLNSQYCAFLIDKNLRKKHKFEISYLPSDFTIYFYVESQTIEGEKAKSEIREVKTEKYLRTFLIKGPAKKKLNEKEIKPSLPEWKFFGSTLDILKFEGLEEGVYYLSFWLFSSDEKESNFFISSDNEIKFFVNGELIEGKDEFKFKINKGWNLILIKKEVKKDSFFSLKYKDNIEKISFVYPPVTYPKLIQSGWGRISVSQLKERLKELEEQYFYFDGITIGFDNIDNICPYGGFWPFSYTVKIDYEKLKPQIDTLKNLKFERWKDNFLWVSAYLRNEENVDWLFDEKIWEIIKENFRIIGKIVKETNCKGIFLDCETPGKKTHIFTYHGYYKEKYNFEDCAKRAFEKGKEIIEILQEEKPDIVVISVDGSRMVGLGRSVFQYHWGNLEKSSVSPGYLYPDMKHRLFYSFLSGMISGSKGKTKIIDGEYSPHIGDTIKGPYYNTKFFVEVMPFLKENFDIKVEPEKLFLNSGVGGRANTYEAPGREREDGGMYEKLIPLLRESYSDYVWIYWQSYTPGYGWYEYYWMDKKKREEMEEKIKKGEIKPFVPNLLEGKPESFFNSIKRAKEEVKE